MSKRIVSVSTLVHYLKQTMEGNPVLHGILVEGEISNLRIPYSGHWYFSLKDDRANISCVMFASSNAKVKFAVKNGDKVTVHGDVSVYEAGGTMQIIATGMEPSGIGALYLQLEALKKKLSAEGLFAEEHKKPLPFYPMHIGLITGNHTAGREDVLITLKKRWPIAQIHEYPCPVQGPTAAPEICKAVQKADNDQNDVILLVRGGGSLEDLWCFNDETLARTIYQATTPIVTGIGHEIDFTIADYVADLRANTPTGAVEAAVPDQNEIRQHLHQLEIRMNNITQNRITHEQNRLAHVQSSTIFQRPERLYSEQINTLNYLSEALLRYRDIPKQKRYLLNTYSHQFSACILQKKQDLQQQIQTSLSSMVMAMKQKSSQENESLHLQQQALLTAMQKNMEKQQNQLQVQMQLLDAYSPLKVMDRGYSIVTSNHQVITSIDKVTINEAIDIKMKDGTLHTTVIGKEKNHGKDKDEF